jgi:formylglycine-generating enzyme required for sulfatase activity
LAGSVWEWVADTFKPYPDFAPQAYAGYSAPWFDGRHRVARGGSFMTQAQIARNCFRNWYEPHLRQPALGLRLAKDG